MEVRPAGPDTELIGGGATRRADGPPQDHGGSLDAAILEQSPLPRKAHQLGTRLEVERLIEPADRGDHQPDARPGRRGPTKFIGEVYDVIRNEARPLDGRGGSSPTVPMGGIVPFPPSEGSPDEHHQQERKSTRLNSSH